MYYRELDVNRRKWEQRRTLVWVSRGLREVWTSDASTVCTCLRNYASDRIYESELYLFPNRLNNRFFPNRQKKASTCQTVQLMCEFNLSHVSAAVFVAEPDCRGPILLPALKSVSLSIWMCVANVEQKEIRRLSQYETAYGLWKLCSKRDLLHH
jgi:hypothetical protein